MANENLGEAPDWLRAARDKWINTGAARPPFAHQPGPGQESVWDYPRPPAVRPDPRLVVVGEDDDPIARSTRALKVMETAGPPVFYLPFADVGFDRLVELRGSSVCEWKGAARYWALSDGSDRAVAWDYPKPFAEYPELVDHVAFYPGRVRCTVAGERVRAQPGEFYGGWVTDDVVGPFKGEPGTEGW